jgi:uncharacterized protein (TIGR00730 family)
MSAIRRICVYAGASNAVAPPFRAAARALGAAIAERGWGLVFGAGRVGLMGEVADGALAAGGNVIGVIPERLQALEITHPGLTELFVVDSMHARKMMMAQLSDAFIALPGGWGTMEELMEITTWNQLGFQAKPVGVLNVDGYYDFVLAWAAQARAHGFLSPRDADLLHAHTDIAPLLDTLAAAAPAPGPRWMSRP